MFAISAGRRFLRWAVPQQTSNAATEAGAGMLSLFNFNTSDLQQAVAIVYQN